ncbi:MAG: hypothetical protein MK089_05895 [Phycisphaerales bacterium]|nr:hypothetical protein [Phycisphaerales bacterium]
MTSAQSISPSRCHWSVEGPRWILAAAMILCHLGLASCAESHKLSQPNRLAAPYQWTALWAVAPLVNESGTSAADTIQISDALTEELQQVNGINTIPVTRTLAVMHRLRMRAVTSPEDARKLMETLGVDGLIVGNVTAWDPYKPPTLGLALQLFNTHDRLSSPRTASLSDQSNETSRAGPTAAAQAAGIFDASDHATLEALALFATGRTHPDSAYGSDIYLVKMDLYTKFVAHQLLAKLLRNEHERLAALNEY